jgi:ribulose-phosphate 3-epimerase
MDFWNSFPKDRLLVDASIWSADITCLRDEMRRVDDWVDLYHFDVSDNHFVPGLLLYPDLVASLRSLTRKPFHVHLMVENPLGLVDEFVRAGANLITVHCDNGVDVASAINKIEDAGINAGLGFGLDTRLDQVTPHLNAINLVLLMGTPMGVKGQGLSPLACLRVQQMKAIIRESGFTRKILVEADGGIRQQTVPLLYAAGVDVVVPGSLIFKSDDLAGTFQGLHKLSR